VLRGDQVIHALGGVGNRELDALGLAVERVARGAKAMISNSLLWNFFRRGEHGFVFPNLLRNQRIELLVHGRQQFFTVFGVQRAPRGPFGFMSLLSCHGYSQALFGRDQMIVVICALIELDPVDGAVELARLGRIVIADG